MPLFFLAFPSKLNKVFESRVSIVPEHSSQAHSPQSWRQHLFGVGSWCWALLAFKPVITDGNHFS